MSNLRMSFGDNFDWDVNSTYTGDNFFKSKNTHHHIDPNDFLSVAKASQGIKFEFLHIFQRNIIKNLELLWAYGITD